MKRVSIVASLLALMVSCTTTTENTAVQSIEGSVSVAYVDMEYILSESDMYQKEGAPLQQRGEATQRDWVQKEQGLQNEVQQLQQKYQNGLITTANAQREQQSIESRMQAFQEATKRQALELDEENRVFAARTQELLRQSIDKVNADRRYSMIIDASSLVDADTTLNISRVVLREFNALYNKK